MRLMTEHDLVSQGPLSQAMLLFPHGLGDIVQLSYVVPFLTSHGVTHIAGMKPAYAPIARGMNGVCVIEGHYGMAVDALKYIYNCVRVRGTIPDQDTLSRDVLPRWRRSIEAHGVDDIVLACFEETEGRLMPPFHTKARGFVRHLWSAEVIAKLSTETLRSEIASSGSPELNAWVRARIKMTLGDNVRVALIARSGISSTGKNWGHLWRDSRTAGEGEECWQFVERLHERDSSWSSVIVDDTELPADVVDRLERVNSIEYRRLFAASDSRLRFGEVVRELVSVADLAVGVPTGPLHLAMARTNLPVIGIWLQHFPSWYEEGRSMCINIVGSRVRELGYDKRRGSVVFDSDPNTHWLVSRVCSADNVIDACEQLGVIC